MFCAYCGTTLQAASRFCPACGQQVPARAAQAAVRPEHFQPPEVPFAEGSRVRHAAPIPSAEQAIAECRSALAYYVPGLLWCGFWVVVWLSWAINPPTLGQIPLIGERLQSAAADSQTAQELLAKAVPYARTAFLLLAAWAAWRGIRWFLLYWNRYYSFTTQRIKIQEGIFTRQTRQIELFRLKDLAITQPLLGQMFHYAHVRFLSADRLAKDELLVAVPNGGAIADAVRNAAQKTRADAGIMQISE